MREGYKNSSVGVIPEDWEIKTLGNICSINMGQSPSSESYNNDGIGLPLIQGNADIKNRLTTPRIFTSIPTKECSINDIIMTVRAPVGAVAKSIHNACIGRGVCSITPQNVFLGFIYQLLIRYESQWAKLEQGSTFTAVNSNEVRNLQVPFPPLAEQEKIAEILTTVDDKLACIEKQISSNEEMKKGLMQKLFSEGIGHHSFKDSSVGQIPESWECIELGKIVDLSDKHAFTGGPFGSDLKSEHYTTSGIRVIQLQNIGDGLFIDKSKIFTSTEKADQLRACNIYPNEIIIAKMAEPLARACKMPDTDERYLMCSDGIRIKVDQMRYNSDFVLSFINHTIFRKQAEEKGTGTTRLRIGLGELKKCVLPSPPLEEQEKIALILTTADEKITILKEKKVSFEELKKGLMQKLLTGEIRVNIQKLELEESEEVA